MSDGFDPVYRFCQWLPRTAWRLAAGLDVRGREHVPDSGPFLLIANHQNNLDPILIQGACPRIVSAMAKSSQFDAPLLGRLIQRLHAFPVRRHQVDPQAVRTTLRLLAAGRPVSIYIEGERSWDGRMQPPKPGTARLVLKAGVPVVPCGISGSYDAWPRWAPMPQRLRVTIAFGPALRFRRIDDRAEREKAVPGTGTAILEAIRKLVL